MEAIRRAVGRGRRRALGAVVVSLTLAGTAGLAGQGAFAEDGTAPAAASASASLSADVADGFASVNALGQNGTYGGRDGSTVTVRTLADLEKYATASQPYVIVVAAAITMDPKGKEIKVASDKTIVGSGTSGQIVGGGFFLGEGVHNVIIRNLTIRDSYEGVWNDKEHDWDAIQMDGAHHVWIDHNDLRHMADGLIDSRKDTTYLTVSWNRLQQNNKSFGIGWTENTTADITIHHNWFHESEQRNPSADNIAHAHLYNNYLQDDPGRTSTPPTATMPAGTPRWCWRTATSRATGTRSSRTVRPPWSSAATSSSTPPAATRAVAPRSTRRRTTPTPSTPPTGSRPS